MQSSLSGQGERNRPGRPDRKSLRSYSGSSTLELSTLSCIGPSKSGPAKSTSFVQVNGGPSVTCGVEVEKRFSKLSLRLMQANFSPRPRAILPPSFIVDKWFANSVENSETERL